MGASRQDDAYVIQRIEAYLANELLPDTKGLAIFSRAGDQPFFLPLQLYVAVPNWVAADSTPDIDHLVELKDMYHRAAGGQARHRQVLFSGLGPEVYCLWLRGQPAGKAQGAP